MAIIPEDKLLEIKDAARIEEVVGQYVKLEQKGRNLLGLCPFHSETKPSFTVAPDKGIFYCFGCGAREEMKKGGGMVDMTKDQLIEMRINQCLVEADGFDLIAMGQPEGPGCYCAANNLVAHFMGGLLKDYPYILMDNEAGMEHMSRLTTNKVDLLVLVSDPSWRGIQAARRLKDLAPALKVVVGRD